MDLSKLFFVGFALCQTKLGLSLKFQSMLKLLKMLIKSKYSMHRAHCAFLNVFVECLEYFIIIQGFFNQSFHP